ncbi:MAG: CopG family transcriptional regulator [Candidatus Sericytochromatia bacterium]|nr:CopG family transcriptional regulator [Candidatus Sericytochromatia bacterium]
MSKTITLRLDENSYTMFLNAANEDNRSISNLIQTLAMRKLKEDSIMDDFEISNILSDKKLLSSLKKGSEQAKQRKGRFVD